MATHRISIFNWQAIPDNTGEVFFEPYPIKATNDRWDQLVLVFNGGLSTKNSLFGSFNVPKNYVDTANLIIVWTSTSTSGDVEWDFAYRAVAGNDTESLDQTGEDESVGSNDTAPSAIHERMEFSIALTDTNLVADDTVEFEFSRDQVDAGDTMAGAALVFGLLLEYNDA